VTPPPVRQAIVDFMVEQGELGPGQEPPRERVYPPVGTLDLDLLFDVLDAEARSFQRLDGQAEVGPAPESQVVRPAIPCRAA
jgi:mannosyl-3-phosphoglycerate synthase